MEMQEQVRYSSIGTGYTYPNIQEINSQLGRYHSDDRGYINLLGINNCGSSHQLLDGKENRHRKLHVLKRIVITVGAILVSAAAVVSLVCSLRTAVELGKVREKVLAVEKAVTEQDEILNLCSSGNGCEVNNKPEKTFRCYKAVQRKRGDGVTWDDAKNICQNLGGFLAEITDHVSLEYVKRVVVPENGNGFWIGATDIGQEGIWTWDHSGQRLSVDDWHQDKNQPDNHQGGEHCLEINRVKRWNDLPCDRKLGFICQKDGDFCDGWM